ncbi:MAG: AAA domain-containing protein [Bacteroidales bacterium]|nr:AAA domain-containing protein [Bacteroidales bacterium]
MIELPDIEPIYTKADVNRLLRKYKASEEIPQEHIRIIKAYLFDESLEYYLMTKITDHNKKITVKRTLKNFESASESKKIVNRLLSSDSSVDEKPPFQIAEPKTAPYRPRTVQAEDLFEFAVKKAARYVIDNIKSDPDCEINSHNQWANICFGVCREWISTQKSDYMSLIKNTYKIYFKMGQGFKYRFDFETIYRDYPHFFKGNEDFKAVPVSYSRVAEALKKEIQDSKKPINKVKYKVDQIELVDNKNHIYQFHLDLGDDEIPSFYDGIKVDFLQNDTFYNCEGIDYEYNEALLYVMCNRPIVSRAPGRIYVDTSFILEATLDRIYQLIANGFEDKNQPGNKFIPDRTRDLREYSDLENDNREIVAKMDPSQKAAHNGAIRNDVSFIWGPPGTGKSFTLAGLINTLYQNKETTLVCCVSNVAVDQLVNKVIDTLEMTYETPYPGELLRSGNTTDDRIIATSYLFPEDYGTIRLRDRISEINNRLIELGNQEDKNRFLGEQLSLKKERIQLRDNLKTRTENLILNSTIVFSTIANYILSKRLENKRFDNLIVDEASMLSIPNLLAISQKVFKRIILVGDPNQLGPISLHPDRLLRNNVFDHCNVFSPLHPALHQLLIQRRSHKFIVNLTNEEFYNGRLVAYNHSCPNWVHEGPFPGFVIKVVNEDLPPRYVDGKRVDDNTQHRGSSRLNIRNRIEVIEILEKYRDYCVSTGENFSIGIITPYRAQVNGYYGALSDHKDNPWFWKSIKVGTIHTFQGAECDLIILDIVEKYPEKVSNILNQKDGERLITVALSRARHKLIVVGDTKRFRLIKGITNVSDKVCRVLTKLSDIKAPHG